MKKKNQENTGPKPLRLMPGVIIVVIQLLIRFVLPILVPDSAAYASFAGPVGWVAVVVWWAFFSRAPRLERWGGILLMVVIMVGTKFFLHESIDKASFGIMYFIIAMPFVSLAFVVWAVLTRNFTKGLRRAALVGFLLIACGFWTLLKFGGVDAFFNADLSWRWAPSPEQRLLAEAADETMVLPSTIQSEETEAEWPAFRGPDQNSIIHGVEIRTDWSISPPVELWRQPVGPGWSSFSVHGDQFFTQEQRGDDEVVSCYSLHTGEPVWRHAYAARFWEAVGGAGPRGTPTLHNGCVYTLGATGILNALNAADGSVIWSRDAASDTKTKTPVWGFASSPLVVDDLVVVAVAGALIAYDRATGEPRWVGPVGDEAYSSPHLLRIDGVEQILQMSGKGVSAVLPADGSLLWEHLWKGYPIVQPALTADGDVLISVDERGGIRRIAVTQGADGWSVETRWTSDQLKPYFNDSVILNGYVYGFDGPKLACIDVEDGTRKWKGGRYGRGQIVLLADQNLLLVLSEKGELALVEAVPEQFTELAKLPAIEGKSWSHPVVVGDILLVRNAQEMAAFRLSAAGS